MTGYPIYVWADSSGDGTDTELFKMANGEDKPWHFDDWSLMRKVRTAANLNTMARPKLLALETCQNPVAQDISPGGGTNMGDYKEYLSRYRGRSCISPSAKNQ